MSIDTTNSNNSTTIEQSEQGRWLATATASSTTTTNLPSTAPLEENEVSLLHEACLRGELSAVKSLIDQQKKSGNQFDVEARDVDNWTPLHCAIAGGSVDLMLYLCDDLGAHLDVALEQEHHEPLIKAVKNGHLEMIKYLAEERGTNIEESLDDRSGMSALHHASSDGHLEIVCYLIEDQYVNARAIASDSWTALHYACIGGHVEIAQYLIEVGGIDADCTEVDNWTPLHVASNCGYLEVVKYLIEEQEVNRNAVINGVKHTALHLATCEDRLDVVKYLIEDQDYEVKTLNAHKETALHLASIYGHIDIVKYFIQTHCTDSSERSEVLFEKDERKRTPYEAATACKQSKDDEYDQEEVVAFLRSYVATLAVASVASCTADDDAAVMLNTQLSCSDNALVGQTYQLIEATEVHEVAYHIMGYLCLSDIKA